MALVQFCGDDSDLDDAELWAVIDNAAASSHSVQKHQSRLKPPHISPHGHNRMNSKLAGAAAVVTELLPSHSPDPCLYPCPVPISRCTPEQKRGQKSQKRFPAQQALEYHADEDARGEVVQRPWTRPPPHKLLKYDNNNNGNSNNTNSNGDFWRHQHNSSGNYGCIVKQMQQSSPSPPSGFKRHPIQELSCREMETKENIAVPANTFWNSGSAMPSAAMFKHYQNTAMSILEKTDYILMQGKPFIKKSGWRKIAFFFNISFEIKDRNIQLDQNSSVLRAEFVVRASMQGGRFSDAWGSCDRGEKRFSKPNHDIPSTAETRAKTRACQDLLGIGEYKQGIGH